MKKIKLDCFYLEVMISGIYEMLCYYSDEERELRRKLLLRLIDECDALGIGKKRRFPFQPVERRIVRETMLRWHNELILYGKPTEDVDYIILLFS